MVRNFKRLFRKVPGIRNILAERDRLRRELRRLNRYRTWRPPGHYYSPVPSKFDLANVQYDVTDLPGIDLNTGGQLEIMKTLAKYAGQFPFPDTAEENGYRYWCANDFFGHTDGLILFCLLLELRPRRVIEVGSGYSSALMLDTNQHFLGNKMALKFVEPCAGRLRSLLSNVDLASHRLVEYPVQTVALSEFEWLQGNDVLFIDSSHVTKAGSDVNYLVFQVLPHLNVGVWVHFHDIFFPFEYIKEWAAEGRAWNESYLLRAFLQYNDLFQIQVYNHYLGQKHLNKVQQVIPRFDANGGSLWLKKTI